MGWIGTTWDIEVVWLGVLLFAAKASRSFLALYALQQQQMIIMIIIKAAAAEPAAVYIFRGARQVKETLNLEKTVFISEVYFLLMQ